MITQAQRHSGHRASKYMVGKSEGKPILGRPRRGWENNIVTEWVWVETRLGLVTGFIGHLLSLTTNNYDNLTELPTRKRATAQFSLAVAWQRLPTADVPLPMGSQTAPGLSYKLFTSHNCNSQLNSTDWLKLLQALASTVILDSESHRTHVLILHSDGIGSLTDFSHWTTIPHYLVPVRTAQKTSLI
jgi:hypothetical protein